MPTKIYAGIIAEYREDGRLLGVMTAVLKPVVSWRNAIVLQHVMLWPGAPNGALVRMLVEVEGAAWAEYSPDAIVLDVEHAHPYAKVLRRLARIRGFRHHSSTDSTTWFIKERTT